MPYDFEFLDKPIEGLPPKIVYVYQRSSGALRNRLRRKLEAAAEHVGWMPMFRSEPIEIEKARQKHHRLYDFKEGIFGEFLEIYSILDAYRFPRRYWRRIYEDFVFDAENRGMLMLPKAKFDYPPPPSDVILLTEPEISEALTDKIVDHFEKSTDLFDFKRLQNESDFRSAVRNYVKSADLTMLDFLQFLDDITLVHIDDKTLLFDVLALELRTQSRVGAFSLPYLNRQFVEQTSEWSFKRFLIGIDVRHLERGVAAPALLGALQRSAAKLLRAISTGQRYALLWAALLIVAEKKLLQGNFVIGIYELCLDYRRAKKGRSEDHCSIDAHLGSITDWMLTASCNEDESSSKRDLAEAITEAATRIGGAAGDWSATLFRICSAAAEQKAMTETQEEAEAE